MKAYEDLTSPLVNYYEKKGILLNILADGTPEEVFQKCLEQMRERFGAF
jgi:adenylate kinase family enzyme